MSQPNNYGFEEEAALLKESARRFFADKLPVEQLHALVADDYRPERELRCKWRRDLWQGLVDLGWTALAVPEDAGGVGMPWVAVAGLLEEVGRAAFPAPLAATLNCAALLQACGAAAHGPLGEIAEGCAATLAVMGESGDWSPAAVQRRDGALHGTACYVQDVAKCQRLLVVAADGADRKSTRLNSSHYS